ncbi:uncharacterized protein LOC115386444 [Salarias fasciatus]|uniref:uncharacterized protein LOC115386444 n=1 Tax=Salarias fasciatus TaxID=181472 RepID=UPI001176576D|nr:uncharacterized protein LOC115386444 [Salarias fasciatus]
MTSWTSSSSLLLLLVLLNTIDLSMESGAYYFNLEFMRDNLDKTIPLIETKDPKDKLECSLEHACQKDNNFCYILEAFFRDETATESHKEILPKCEGIPSRNVSVYQFLCTLAKSFNLSTEVCESYDATCSFLSGVPYTVTNLTTPTTPTTTPTTTALPERTTPALPLNTTSVQPSANAGQSADKRSGNNSTGDTDDKGATVTSEWRIACLLLLFVCFVLLGICLWLCYQRRRDAQLLNSIAERNHPLLPEIQSEEPHASGGGAEATIVIQTETSINEPPVRNGSQY